MGQPYLLETGCNWAYDPDDTTNPDLASSDWQADLDNQWTISDVPTLTPIFIRLQVENNGSKDADAANWTLMFNTIDDPTPGGSPSQVTTTSTPLRIVDDGGSNDIADQAATTARRCASSFGVATWSNGKYVDASSQATSLGLAVEKYTELMFCIQGLAAAAGNTYYLWLYYNGAVLDQYNASNTATITFASAAPTADISDSITITESVTAVITPLVPNVNDSIAITENVETAGQLVASVADTVTVAESVAASSVLRASVFDTIAITEAVATNLDLAADIFDSLTVNEAVSTTGRLYTDIADLIAVDEFVNIRSTIQTTVFDTIAIAESIDASIGLAASVFDAITVAEAVTSTGTLYASVADTISIAENVTPEFAGLAPLAVNVNDTISIAESVATTGRLYAAVADTLSIAENVDRNLSAVGALNANVNDVISIAEAVVTTGTLYASVVDTITVAEDVTPEFVGLAPLAVDVNNVISVAESVALTGIMYADVADSISISENVDRSLSAVGALNANVNDVISIAEAVETTGNLYADVFDSILISEYVNRESPGLPPLNAEVYDSITIAESLDISSTSNVSVSDSLTVSDAVSAVLPILYAAVEDTIAITEVVTTNNILAAEVSDAIVVTELVDTLFKTTWTASVSDTVIVSESVTAYLTTLNVIVIDSISIVESLSTSGTIGDEVTNLLCADTAEILTDWVEDLYVQRRTVTYDVAGVGTESWGQVDAFEGDWQPTRGALVYAEAGKQIPCDARVFGPCGIDVEVGDRIVQIDDSFMEVVFVAVHEGHTTIFLREATRDSISTAMIPTVAANKTDLVDDTDTILEDWYETLIVNRRTNGYNTAGEDTSTYARIGTVVGDWQEITGILQAEEMSNLEHSIAQVITRPDVDIREDDQLVRMSGDVYYVNYVKPYEDHFTIRIKRTEGQPE